MKTQIKVSAFKRCVKCYQRYDFIERCRVQDAPDSPPFPLMELTRD